MPFAFGGTGTGGGGDVTASVYTPAVALFEHPEDATATFLADTGNTNGLTVTLREPLEYGQDTSDWSIIGAQRYQGVAEVTGVAASVDIPTSATGGIRVTADDEGADGNNITVNITAGTTAAFWVSANQTVLVGVSDGATAGEVIAAINVVAAAPVTAAIYGTEIGTTVVRTGATILAGFGGDHDLAGGIDAVDEVEADPVHVTIDIENTLITAHYNLAAGGMLTAADTLGDLKGAFDTAGDGLSSEYVGGGAETDVMTRPFATSDQFSMADLRGLQLMLTDPLAAGAAGNAFGLVARARFPGGAEVSEVQAHILIYSRTDRGGGVRVEIDADIQGLNEHGVPVDVSSGALGNEWRFTAVSASGGLADTITVDTSNRILTYYGGGNVTDIEANHIRTACNRGGTGCSARSFGTYFGGAHVFDGSLGRVNTRPQQFHGGRDYHAATANPEPITVTAGPTHAHTRLYTVAGGGIVLSLTDPAHDAGNGFSFDASEGDPLSVSVFPMHRRIALTIPSAGSTAADILAAFNANDSLSAVYFGTETGTTTVMHDRFGRHEMLGGLDATEVEVQYAPVASGAITAADTMGAVKTAWDDRAAGRISFYYGGADAATVASRLVPWEHEFENGVTDVISLAGFGLGPEQNEFTGADRAAAETARDTYAAANPTWVEAYRGAASVWIALRWGTAPGEQVGQTLRANASNPPVAADWTDQDLALRGAMGQRGLPGADAMVTAGNVNPLIAGYTGSIPGLQISFTDIMGMIADGQIPAAIMRDAEFTSAATIALITGNIAFSDIAGMVADSQVPASFMRDAEFTRSAIATLLGITDAQVDEILVGNPTISGQVLTFTRADGTTVDITIPAGMTGGTADGRLRFGTTVPADAIGIDGDSFAVIDTTDGTAAFYEKAGGTWTLQFTVDLTQTGGDHTRLGAISADETLDVAEVMAGTSTMDAVVTMPIWAGGVQRFRFVGVPTGEDDITDIQQGGLSVFASFERYVDNQGDDIIVSDHKWWKDVVATDGLIGSGGMLTIIQ